MVEEFLNVGGAVDAQDNQDSTDRLWETVRFWVKSWGEVPKPHVEGGPFETDVGTGTKV